MKDHSFGSLSFGVFAAIFLGVTAEGGHAQTLLHAFDFTSAGNVVDSAGTAQGSLMGGAQVVGGVLMLDGIDDYVQFDSKLVPTSGAFSVSFFAKRAGDGPGSNYIEWISQGVSGGPGFYIGYRYFSSGATNQIRITDNFREVPLLSFPADLVEHHVAVTTDGNSTWFYLDGVLAKTLPGGIPTTLGGVNTRFGCQFDGKENFHGEIDEMRIFSGTLDPCTVMVLSTRGIVVADCNANGIPDECDLASGASLDCNGNGIPDSCDLLSGAALDCNGNGIPDECDLASGASLDCNANGIADFCDLLSGVALDCNANGVPDECDLTIVEMDIDGDGQLDDCVAPPLMADVYEMSVASGGTQNFTLTAPVPFALYLLMGTASGTSPGTPSGSFIIPLNVDAYLLHTLLSPNVAPLGSSFGGLTPSGTSGTATASFSLPPAFNPVLVGLTLHHAYVTFDIVSGHMNFVSNAVPLALLP